VFHTGGGAPIHCLIELTKRGFGCGVTTHTVSTGARRCCGRAEKYARDTEGVRVEGGPGTEQQLTRRVETCHHISINVVSVVSLEISCTADMSGEGGAGVGSERGRRPETGH
jgi:hypothetical protein